MGNESVAKIITVYNEKGGSGKTTTTCQLAGTLGHRGYDVLVADLDPQQTSANWLGTQDGANFPATIWPGFRYGTRIKDELQKLVTKYDIIVADCEPSVERAATWTVLLLTDIALIPTKLNPPDLAALPAAKNLAKRAMEACGRNFPVRIVPNAVSKHLKYDEEVLKQLAADSQFPPLPMTLGDRKVYSRSMLVGSTVHALKGSDDSVREIEQLADLTLKMLGLPMKKSAKGARK